MDAIEHEHQWRPVGMTDPPDHFECAVDGCDATTVEAMVYVPEAIYRGAVGALLAAPMPEVESTLKGEEWAERYGEWWHEHVRPHIVGGQ